LGRSHYALFSSEVVGESEASVCFDWSEIEIATGSYLKAAYLPIFRVPHGVPILTSGVSREIREELELALETETRPIFLVEKVGGGRRTELSLIGHLDEAYRRTLGALIERGHASASELHTESFGKSPQIGKTAWINRLNRMYEMGLIRRNKLGKGYRYSIVVP
jgi:hypothetical protein